MPRPGHLLPVLFRPLSRPAAGSSAKRQVEVARRRSGSKAASEKKDSSSSSPAVAATARPACPWPLPPHPRRRPTGPGQARPTPGSIPPRQLPGLPSCLWPSAVIPAWMQPFTNPYLPRLETVACPQQLQPPRQPGHSPVHPVVLDRLSAGPPTAQQDFQTRGWSARSAPPVSRGRSSPWLEVKRPIRKAAQPRSAIGSVLRSLISSAAKWGYRKRGAALERLLNICSAVRKTRDCKTTTKKRSSCMRSGSLVLLANSHKPNW